MNSRHQSSNGRALRGLVIREPWIDLILNGEKTWEIRSTATKVRERIALIRGGSGTVVGCADLVGCEGPFNFEALRSHRSKHAVPDEPLRAFVEKYKGRAFAWVLQSVRSFSPTFPYRHPSGAVIWVTLDPELSEKIRGADVEARSSS